LDKALKNGRIPACADIASQADMYVAACDYLLSLGTERLVFAMAKAGADVYAFGCCAEDPAAGTKLVFVKLL